MKAKIFFFFLFVSSLLIAQDIDSLETILYNYKDLRDVATEKVNEIQSKHPLYRIFGDIKGIYYDGAVIQLMGVALPVENILGSPGTMINRGNIFITSPKKEYYLLADAYEGYHYYIRTETAETVLGAATLVKYYGDLPREEGEILKEKQNEIKILDENIKVIGKEVAKLKSDISKLRSKQLYKDGEYYKSISELNIVIKYSPNDEDIYDILYDDYLAIIFQSNNIDDCKNTISLLETTLFIPKYTLAQCARLRNEYSNLCIKVAKDYNENKLYNNAVMYCELALKYGNYLDENDKKIYSSIYYDQGNDQLKQNLIEDAKKSYKQAVQFDITASPMVFSQLNSQMKSVFLYTTLSTILPGMGLIAQGESNGWIYFGICVTSAMVAVVYNKETMNNPGITVAQAENKKSSMGIVGLSIGVGLITYIVGIVKTISKVKEYNQKYDIGFNIDTKNISLAMKINF
jgi:hypothetical protein